jgi:hypothetical protein
MRNWFQLSGIRIRESATWSVVLSKVQTGIRAGVNDGALQQVQTRFQDVRN